MGGVDWGVVPAPEQAGRELHELMRELFPIRRSLTGDGVRETLRVLAREVPLELVETPSGTRVFDWTLPPEWNIRDAWIEDSDGERVLDLADSSLHVLGYSTPIRATVSLAELREHVYTHPDEPDWIPYRTSYYVERWGFCMERRRLDALAEGDYEVCIDSTLSPRTRCCSRRTSAIPRSPTTTSRVSSSWRSSARCCSGCGCATATGCSGARARSDR